MDVHAAQLNGAVLYIPQRGDQPGDGLDLCNVVGVGEGGDQRLHDAEGKHDDRQKCFCRQCAVHRKETAHRQDAEKR